VEDENADRVYVPGTTPNQPARDVEPFWPPADLPAPNKDAARPPEPGFPATPGLC